MTNLLDSLGDMLGQVMLIGFVFGILCSVPAFLLGFLLGRRSAPPTEE